MTCSLTMQDGPEIKLPDGLRSAFVPETVPRGGHLFNQILFVDADGNVHEASKLTSAPTDPHEFFRTGLETAKTVHVANRWLKKKGKYKAPSRKAAIRRTQQRSQ